MWANALHFSLRIQKALNSFFETNMEKVFEIEDSPVKVKGRVLKRKNCARGSPGGW